MSYWIEVHCDAIARRDVGEPARYHDDECYSFHNNNPGIMVRGLAPAKLVQQKALSEKWELRGRRWFCPACAKLPH